MSAAHLYEQWSIHGRWADEVSSLDVVHLVRGSDHLEHVAGASSLQDLLLARHDLRHGVRVVDGSAARGDPRGQEERADHHRGQHDGQPPADAGVHVQELEQLLVPAGRVVPIGEAESERLQRRLAQRVQRKLAEVNA